jgi:hypothetical protein
VRKAEDDTGIKMKYDILSIIFISCILVISVFFYTATYSVSLLASRDDVYTVLGIKTDDVYYESSMELTGANELVVFGGFGNVKAIPTSGENIRVEYGIEVSTNDKEYAESSLEKMVRFETGERTHMLSNDSRFYNNRRMSYPIIHCIIYLPQDKKLDLSQFHGPLEYDSILESRIIHTD